MLKKVTIVTDGATSKNPGPGGWACVLIYKSVRKELYGYEKETTNNRMEMMAAIQGLSALTERCDVTVITDSEYLQRGMTWYIHKWIRNGWLTATQKPVINQDLWLRLIELQKKHLVSWSWVRGHDGHQDNELCDQLARSACQKQISNLSRKSLLALTDVREIEL